MKQTFAYLLEQGEVEVLSKNSVRVGRLSMKKRFLVNNQYY